MNNKDMSHQYQTLRSIDDELEDQVLRLLLMGNSQECALFENPENLHKKNYFVDVIKTILAFANSFGGWLIFGISSSWIGNIVTANRPKRLKLSDILTRRPSWFDETAAKSLHKTLQPFNPELIIGKYNKNGLGRYFLPSKLHYSKYSHEWNRSRTESVEWLLKTDFLTSCVIKLSDNHSLLALRVQSLADGELRHKDIKSGDTIIRVGNRNETRENLIGINWSIYQTMRLQLKKTSTQHTTQYERFFFGKKTPSIAERVKARAMLIEFLNTLKPDRRLDLAMELTSLCWNQLGDRDLFETTLATLYTAELGGRYTNERFWRDHVVHQMYVFLLGIYLWNSCPPLRSELEEISDAPFIWAMIATCHDLGYPFELFVVNLLMQIRDLAPHQKKGLPVFPRIKDLGKKGNQSYWKLLTKHLWPNIDSKVSLLEILFDQKSQESEVPLLDHGIVSSLLFLSLITKIRGEWQSTPDEEWILRVASAIAVHNLKRTEIKKALRKAKLKSKPVFSSEKHPFAILLALCDNLQEWDRIAAARHILIPGAVQIQTIHSSNDGHCNITARFGLDSRIAGELGKVFDGQTGCFDLGNNISIRTESFFHGLTSLNDETMRLATLDPWMKKEDLNFVSNFEFVEFGHVVNTSIPGKVYLDTGHGFEKGIIDNHASRGLSGSALLVFEYPELITDHTKNLSPGDVTIVLHTYPDMDGITAAFFCQELLVKGKIPDAWKPLAKYIDLADRALLPIDWNFPSTLWGIFQAFVRSAPRKEHDSEFLSLQRVRRGFMVLRYITQWLEDNINDPEADPETCIKDAFGGAHPFERIQAESGKDYDIFRDMFDKGEVLEKEILLPLFPFPDDRNTPFNRERIKLLVSPKRPRSQFFPQWAALEGYGGTIIHNESTKFEKKKNAWKPGVTIIRSLSTEPDKRRMTFWGLGHLLDDKETEARKQKNGPKRRKAVKIRRPLYSNDDPWYDNRESQIPGSIISVPRSKTYLTPDEIEKCLEDTDTWIGIGEMNREI